MGRREAEEEFGDLCYEAWRTGHDPNNVSRDDFDYMLSRGFSPDEIRLRDCIPGEPGL